jgi:tripeptide aminopeptidase
LENKLQFIIHLAALIQQIPAPTGNEQKRGLFIADQFTRQGLKEVQIDRVGNVWGFLPGGSAKPLVISAHLDTVHDLDYPLPLKIVGSRIIGPGIGDNSLAIAMMIALIKDLVKNKEILRGGIWFIANVGEEGLGNLKGMVEIVDKMKDRALAYVILEGLGLGNIFHESLGIKRYRITFRTPGGHSWQNFGSPSAIHDISRLITSLIDLPLLEKNRVSLNVGTIQGGTTVNSIASNATIDVDLRSVAQESLKAMDDMIHSFTQSYQSDLIKTEILSIGDRPSGSIPKSHPLVQLAVNSLERLGISHTLGIASTDANIPLSRGLPAICIGLTYGERMHTLDEYIETEPILIGFQQLLGIVTGVWNCQNEIQAGINYPSNSQ